MKVEVFKFKASECNLPDNGGGMCLDENNVTKTINEFCAVKEIIDIKVSTIETKYHNNAGCNEVYLVYTIMYS